MHNGRTLCAASWRVLTGGILVATLSACAALPPNSLLDPTKVGRFSVEAHEAGIRRVLTPRDTPTGLAHATDPAPEDLVADYSEYRLRPGDSVAVSVNDLIQIGEPFQAALRINGLGEIRLPEVGSIHVAGMTEIEIEQEIRDRLIESGVLPDPIVQVFQQVTRGRTFTALGNVGNPGQYPIPIPGTRLLDVMGIVGDVGANVRRMYVIRRSEAGLPPMDQAMPMEAQPAQPVADDLVVPPPDDLEPQPEMFTLAGGGQEAPGEGVESEEAVTREELAEVIAPGAARSRPSTLATGSASEPAFEPLVFDPETGEVLPAPEGVADDTEIAGVDDEGDGEEDLLSEPFDWEDVDEYEFDQRVIEIDVTELRNGNPRYNIVIRDGDVIHAPIDTGVFYVMGEVNRPGVYSFGGREITIKQAIASVGGFSALAWPQRCELIRREPGTDKQITMMVNLDAVFAGLEDDFYLRDNDIVNVGTHIAAPFLFVIRNSFRFTYGFGFVFDRNFADRYAYGARINPETLERQERLNRGLPF